ncbi:MAG: HPr(Ser) kinase/phosphatase [Candidatus Izemoplasmatales bacterium]|jgi:HPr kinase/phosphorylase|nr:HPr(Ser) kinase/phosphatase [Candidatus Izemoplasmatales bacterium]MDD4354411.1 HPr(Ser) kinase/phosphatase [Candidatus Izemoplasmatales bacterium]MDD4987409.1 HPr(Ser) kinase/phosphatase [Candidatus Izemoplasmatales bacterium]MDD5601535.1 HPr(Ser) kinase/phosphatase [Candidatus Izemoplasmatales bacterium]MDY0372540.1 HPr(Ser) kinase/phosphatase [Candidatus Izemoplasmatales bacterium]
MALTVASVIAGLNLDILAGKNGIQRLVTEANLTKPGLELAGLFDFYEHDRIQIIGSKEGTFFHWLSKQDQAIRVRMLFEKQPPAFIFSRHVEVPPLFLQLGDEFEIPILKSNYNTSSLFSELFSFLQSRLAERITLHGVLMDINGVGVLITGESGVGKSEVALELVRRGYMLVADDLVEIYQREKGILIGEAPELLKKYLEIRGIGIVNVIYLFGVKAYRENKKISLYVRLRPTTPNQKFDRLGLTQETETLFDTEIPAVTLPISAARNAATLVEAAAYDIKSKNLGYHSPQDFNEQLNAKIQSNQQQSSEEDK